MTERSLTAPMALSHVGVIVADMARAVAYYRRVLGFTVFYDNGAPATSDHVVIGLVGGTAIELTRRAGEGRANDTCVTFSVPDIEAAFQGLAQDGAADLSPLATLQSGVRCATFRDPDGNMLEIIDLGGRASLAEFAAPRKAAGTPLP